MDDVEIAEYDPAWPGEFEREARLVRAALPEGLILAIEHIGSTAVPGLAAKPVIDLLVVARSLGEARLAAVAPLEELGYAYWADNPKPDRLFFVKGLPPRSPRRTHHLHVGERGGELCDRLVFRDYLRAHAEEARRYARLKHELAAAYKDDREAYTAAKAVYIASVMEKARSRHARDAI